MTDMVMVPDTSNTTTESLLAKVRSLVDPALRAVIDTVPPGMRLIIGYHFGLWDEVGTPTTTGGGKAIRPALVMASCELVGGRAEAAVPAALAVELVHNFTLLHDDIMDGDRTRRNRPAAWTAFGVPAAILAGDTLQVMAFRQLAQMPGAQMASSFNRIADCMMDLCEGQHRDCSFERRNIVGVDECSAMAEAKTGSLFGCCCALGALAAGADAATADTLDQWGRRMGEAFQLVDDLLGIWGDPRLTGKPVYSDLASRKKSMPVVAALTSTGSAGSALADLYLSAEPMTVADQEHAAELIDSAGAREWTANRIDSLVADAEQLLRGVKTHPAGAEGLGLLADLIIRRDR